LFASHHFSRQGPPVASSCHMGDVCAAWTSQAGVTCDVLHIAGPTGWMLLAAGLKGSPRCELLPRLVVVARASGTPPCAPIIHRSCDFPTLLACHFANTFNISAHISSRPRTGSRVVWTSSLTQKDTKPISFHPPPIFYIKRSNKKKKGGCFQIRVVFYFTVYSLETSKNAAFLLVELNNDLSKRGILVK
jgi:hypothetical protein